MLNDDRREHARISCLGIVYQQTPEGTEQSIGYILNLSKSGANLWIDIDKIKSDAHFSIRLKKPSDKTDIELPIQPLWEKVTHNGVYKVVGTKFTNLNETQKNQFEELFDIVTNSYSTK